MQDRLQYLVFRVFVDHLDSMVPRVNLDPGPVPFFLDFNQHWYGSKPDRPTTFRARSFSPSFIYLLTTRSIPQRIILSLFPYRLCPSLNSGVARFFKKGSQLQTKGTHQIVIYRPSRRVLPIITLHNNAYKGWGRGGEGATDDTRRGYLRTLGKSPSYALVIPCIHYSIVINFLHKIDFEKLSLAASNF